MHELSLRSHKEILVIPLWISIILGKDKATSEPHHVRKYDPNQMDGFGVMYVDEETVDEFKMSSASLVGYS